MWRMINVSLWLQKAMRAEGKKISNDSSFGVQGNFVFLWEEESEKLGMS